MFVDDDRTGELARRLDAVERRVARLERGGRAAEAVPAATAEAAATAQGAATSQGAAPGMGPEFWVVEGLRARLGPGSGAVVLAGVVRLAAGEQYAWQYGQTVDELLGTGWQELGRAIAALGHPVRLRLLQLILSGTRSAAELQSADELGTSGQLYHHLRQLTVTGWLVQTARGHYSVPGSRVIPLLVLLAAAGP